MSITAKLLKEHVAPIFVETGIYRGGGIQSALDAGYQTIFAIEIEDNYFKNAKNKFEKKENVNLYHGDSGKLLEPVIQDILCRNEKAVISLDAHIGNKSPLKAELQAIKRGVKSGLNCVVIIDDMNFIRAGRWADLSEDLLNTFFADLGFEVSLVDGKNYNKGVLVAKIKE